MRKQSSMLLASLLVALVASPGLAQNWSAGVKGGIDFANLGGDVEDLDSKLGFSVGATLGARLHEYFSLEILAQYVQKGAEEEELGIKVENSLDYFEVLVPATLTIPIENSPLTPRLFAGPAVAFESSCKVSAEGGGVSAELDCDQISDFTGDPDDNIETKSVDFGVFFGGGFDFRIGTGALTFDALYNLGLTNINDIEGAEDFEIKNKNIQLLVGYKFFFGA